MGNSATKRSVADPGLEAVLRKSETRHGVVAITGRYHRPPKKIEDDYDLGSTVLGSGYNGQVYMATSKAGHDSDGNPLKFAIKDFKLRDIDKKKREELESECEIFLGMDHPHVARLVDVYESEEKLSLVMECMEGGELFDRVIQRKKFTERDAANAAHQMLLALNYLHYHNVVHRDIKLENWLYEKDSTDHLKLIDFGFSKVYNPDTDMKMRMSCGTLAYVAPEVLNKSYGVKCDMWSVGVVIFILLVGYMPFSGPDEKQIANIREGKFTLKPDKWSQVSEEALDFIKKLIVVNPVKRMSAEEALNHPWIIGRTDMLSKHGSGSSVTADVEESTAHSLFKFSQESKFRRSVLATMAWSLSPDERRKVRDQFLAIDTTHSGTITLEEFKQVITSQDTMKMDEEQMERVFKQIDVAGNNEIQYSEFLAAMVSQRIALHEDLLKQTFRRFDKDNSGFIDIENLKEVLGESFSPEEITKIMAEVDTNGDGKIEYYEFMAYLRGSAASEEHKDHCDRLISHQLQRMTREQG